MSNTETHGNGQRGLPDVLVDVVPRQGTVERVVAGTFHRLESQRRRRVLAFVGLAAAATAAVLLVLVLARTRQAPPVAPRSPAGMPLAVTGKDLVGPSPPAGHALGGHRVHLAPAARIRVERATPDGARLHLKQGRATFQVRPLGHGSFVVRTDQVKVEVVGTRFSVAVQQRCSVVGVQQGTVRVTAAAGAAQPLRAGEERTFCAPPFPPGELDEGGRLVQQALDLLAAGVELERADGLLSRYLQRYPGGPFAEEALFHRVFVMQRLGRPQRARALARQFLQRFSATPRAARIRDWLQTQDGPP